MGKSLIKWWCLIFCISIAVITVMKNREVPASALNMAESNIQAVSGYVQLDEFSCKKIDLTTTEIYINGVFINTSAEKIKTAAVTVEFIDLTEYTAGSEYTPIATYIITLNDIDSNNEKEFSKTADVIVSNPNNNIYNMWIAGLWTENAKLGAFYYKIDYII